MHLICFLSRQIVVLIAGQFFEKHTNRFFQVQDRLSKDSGKEDSETTSGHFG